MNAITSLYQRLPGLLSGAFVESIALLLTRVALAGIFWRSYQTKVALAAFVSSRGPGLFSLDAIFARITGPKAA